MVRESVDHRLQRHGAKDLADGELLALILGGDGPGALALSAELLRRHGGLPGLARLDPRSLPPLAGLGAARTRRLSAAVELAQRLRADPPRPGGVLQGPEDVIPILVEEFRGCDREHFLALHLDTRHRLRSVETVSVGSLNASLVHPREVFRRAVTLGTAALIVAHNHPSGCAEPSREDVELTARLAECGRLMGIELLDHFVVGAERTVSFREHGWPGS
ncbi:MAG TPA: DNA repair protein RadC [Candidatus Krumholzibacteria bacterium]|nr:DNA repair protein RadC [Candidatus Krumholzibacteria bacterium]HRX50319.1 DNA repair protein RadC [Candidatus Krumholzibacteria bacterium]